MSEAPAFAAHAEAEPIASLDLSMFGLNDAFNVVLQRSQVLFDLPRPGELIRAFTAGEPGPLREAVAARPETILRRGLASLYHEFLALRRDLDRLAPKQLADIGCGYAFFDLFVGQESEAQMVLIDLERNDATHFGFEAEGAAYSDLSVARAFLEANGIEPGRISTLNPERDDVSGLRGLDLVMSLLSCGFHYPLSTYGTFFRESVRRGGIILVDLRAQEAGRQIMELARIGAVRILSRDGPALRVAARRSLRGFP